MVIQELTERECRDILAGIRVARLGCARDNQPYVVPVHVDFDGGDYLYGYTTLGTKIEWMRQNPRVCLEMDDLSTADHWISVVAFGHYEELPNTLDHADSRNLAHRLFQRHPAWWEPASVPLGADERRPPIVYRIRIERMTGRRAVLRRVSDDAAPVPSESNHWTWFRRFVHRGR